MGYLIFSAKEVWTRFTKMQSLLQWTWANSQISIEHVSAMLQRVCKGHWIQETRLMITLTIILWKSSSTNSFEMILHQYTSIFRNVAFYYIKMIVFGIINSNFSL